MFFLKCRLCNIKELPKKTKDRTDNTLYMVKGEPRFWRTGRLLCIHNKRSPRCKECNLEGFKKQRECEKKQRMKHQEKIKEYRIKYYKENKEEIKKDSKIRCKKWRNENQYKIFYYRCLSNGFKHTDKELKEIFKRREESTKCELCNTKYKNNYDKHTDHHRSSGSFRNICCNKCNINIGVVDRKKDKVLLELHRYFIFNNIYIN